MRVSIASYETLLGAAATGITAALCWYGLIARVPHPAPIASLPASAAQTPAPPSALPETQPQHAVDERLDSSFDHDASAASSATPIADYELRATLDPGEHRVTGVGVITWRNRSSSPVDALYVHAYLNAFKNARSTFMLHRAGDSRGAGPLRAPGALDVQRFSVRELGDTNLWPRAERMAASNPDDETDLRLALPRPVLPGETLHIDVAFVAKLPALVERTGWQGSFHMVAQWFPKLAKLEPDGTFAHFPFQQLAEFYADFGSYDVTIDVPANFEIGATGRRETEVVEGGRRIARYVQANVHDFAFAAYDGFRIWQIEDDGVSIRCLAPEGYEAAAKEEIEVAAWGLRQFGKAYGRYPYETLTIVHPPEDAEEAGGMEYPTLITTGGPWLAHPSIGSLRGLTLHELAHQYFYGLVATNEEKWPFLDEGLATYAQLEAMNEGWGAQAVAAGGGLSVGTDALYRWFGVPEGSDDTIAQPASAFLTGHSYGRLVYGRTALVLRTIDQAYEPGALRKALGRYARRYRFAHPGPSQLLGAVRDTVGDAAERNLRIALFERGWVDYALTDILCDDGGATNCRLIIARRGTLSMPVDVDVLRSDGTRTRLRWNGDGHQIALDAQGSAAIVSAVIDPEHRILIDEDLANNAMTMTGTRRAWRVWERAAYEASIVLGSTSP